MHLNSHWTGPNLRPNQIRAIGDFYKFAVLFQKENWGKIEFLIVCCSMLQ